MKIYCSHCHNEIEDEKVIYFPYNKGRLCWKCYELYDLENKFIDQDFNVGRGFKKVNEK